MKTKDYDVVIIGGGIAGYESSKYLARAGKKVALVEKEKLGGTAIRWGALPIKKILDSFKNINGILGMAHVGIQQGMGVGQYILSGKGIELSYDILPRAIFTLPEMAGVGKQEWELKDGSIPYKVGKAYFKDNWRAWAKGIEEGFVKVLLNEKDIVLGIWMVGENVSEYIGLIGDLIKNESTADDILSNLIIHPSLSESIRDALLEGKNRKVIR